MPAIQTADHARPLGSRVISDLQPTIQQMMLRFARDHPAWSHLAGVKMADECS